MKLNKFKLAVSTASKTIEMVSLVRTVLVASVKRGVNEIGVHFLC